MPTQSNKLKLLQKKWYRLLKECGFEDIEKDERDLKEYHSQRFQHYQGFTEKQRYYELAGQLLHTFPFTSKVNRTIWRMHSEGESALTISNATGVSEFLVNKSIKYVASHIKE